VTQAIPTNFHFDRVDRILKEIACNHNLGSLHCDIERVKRWLVHFGLIIKEKD
jgi:hypothetical protein